ncbi:GAF domain-containing protein [Leptolyngbya sp. 'hensonii']|uniref:GAF domain-containing sensor histidine kinase n=1 Tax=Leptolyngbya sp. 'hensonii' TaxID=1922337 RepID=UPI0015C55732|nr:GAF domain-containing protein [Leptolyngbya sp. 'hensonii']
MITRIRRSLQLQEILEAAVTEIRAFLQIDRVMIYQFHPDEHGVVIAEAIHRQRLPSLLGLHFPADDIPHHARQLFLKVRQRSIINLSAEQMGWSVADAATVEDGAEAAGDMRYRPVDPCHVEYMRAMGVESSIVVPIIQDQKLWGLLVAHHSEPRMTSDADLAFLQIVVDQLEVAINQALLLEQVQQQARRESITNQIATLLHLASTTSFQAALESAVAAIDGAGGRLYLLSNYSPHANELFTCGAQPPISDEMDAPLEEHEIWHVAMHYGEERQTSRANLWIIPDLYQDYRCRSLAPFFKTTSIRSILIVPLKYGRQVLGCLTLFRHEFELERLWAGQFDPDERQRMPRKSFAAWREYKTGQASNWTEADLDLVQTLISHFALAIGQYQLQKQVHQLNCSLEQQVQARTAELQQTNLRLQDEIAERQQMEDALRQSEARFQRLVANVPGMIYQFRLTAEGETYFPYVSAFCRDLYEVDPEVIQQDAAVILGMVHPDDREKLETSIARSARTLQPWLLEHRVVTPSGQVKWLQAASRPEKQDNGEIVWDGVLMDITDRKQAEAVLRESEAQLREKAQELEQTLRELQHTQAQLVQTEKMSSLGQLVAGVAHEINNPVNFIYGNLSHAGEYVHDLLSLLKLYQQYYPDPVAEIQSEASAIDIDFLQQDLPKLLNSMKVGADRIQKIVLALRNFSRMDEADVKPVDIHEGIDSTLMILQNRLKETSGHPGIHLVKQYAQLPLIECYAGQLNQVFMNILSNAIDSLEEFNHHRSPQEICENPCTITIETRLVEDLWLQIRIADNGPGMTEQVRQRLFEPFFTTKPVGKGTGLGLSISYQVVVDKHGGKLTCNSALGAGAEFLIELPIRRSGRSHGSSL